MNLYFRYEKSTQSKIRWAMKAYVRWMNCRNYQVQHGLISEEHKVPSPDELLTIVKEEVVKVVCLFILEVRDANGNDYNRDTLYDLIVMVQSFFKQNRLPYHFFEDDAFFDIKNTLDNCMKQLTKEGKIAPRIKAVPISCAEEEKLWMKGLLGDDNPTKLIDTLVYLLGLHFALRAAEEHKNLKAVGKVLYDDEVGLKYLYYQEVSSKCNQGGIASRGIPPKTGCVYENVVNSDRCVVRLFEKYMSHRPSHLPKCSPDFYLRPLTVPNGNVWYSCQARGRHSIEKVIKELCKQGGFDGKRTNHSMCAASATHMYEQGADEQLICEKTGHRSVAVCSYKRTSGEQLKNVTDMLYGTVQKPLKQAKLEFKGASSATVSVPPSNKGELERFETTSSCEGDKIAEKKGNDVSHSLELGKGLVLNININVQK